MIIAKCVKPVGVVLVGAFLLSGTVVNDENGVVPEESPSKAAMLIFTASGSSEAGTVDPITDEDRPFEIRYVSYKVAAI